jgi:hypothetical protein
VTAPDLFAPADTAHLPRTRAALAAYYERTGAAFDAYGLSGDRAALDQALDQALDTEAQQLRVAFMMDTKGYNAPDTVAGLRATDIIQMVERADREAA